MDNRTIRTAIMNRVPEVYHIFTPIRKNGKVYLRMYVNIDGKLYKMLGDMPDTALISHRELLNTMVSELHDEVSAIRRGIKSVEFLPEERDWTPISEDDKNLLTMKTMEEALSRNAPHFIESSIIPEA